MSSLPSIPRRDSVRAITLTFLAIGTAAFGYACADASRSTAPGASARQLNQPEVTPGVVTLCKVGADGRFTVQVGVGATPTTVDMAHNSCQTIASVPPAQADDVIVTVTENPSQLYSLDHIVLEQGSTAARTIAGQRSVSFEAAHGAVVTYHNNAVINVCKHGTSATFEYQVGLGQPTLPLSLADGECHVIGTVPSAQADDVIVTVREMPSSSYAIDHLELQQGLGGVIRIDGKSELSFEGAHGALLSFFNNATTSGTSGGTHETGGTHGTGGTTSAKCDADKSLKDAHTKDENHDCRSEQGEAHGGKH